METKEYVRHGKEKEENKLEVPNPVTWKMKPYARVTQDGQGTTNERDIR